MTLSSQQNRNALNSILIDKLRTVLHKHAAHKRIILLNSDLAGFFCTGMDLQFLEKQMAQLSQMQLVESINNYIAFLQELMNLPCLVLTEVDGFTLGGGLDLLGGSDLVIASDRSSFSIAELSRHFFPVTNSAMLIPIIGKNAFLYWCLNGQNYSAKKLRRMGLIAQVVAVDQLKKRREQLISQILSYDESILQLGIHSMRQVRRMRQEEYLSYMSAQLAHSCRIRNERMATKTK